jgi:carbamoyl-phosphate synthase / aspartate carbamoyltransferase / dihydroorotase
MLTLPGLIDPHTHLREPGGAHKEDFDSGTAAALAGGFTHVSAMPNTTPPIVDAAALALARERLKAQARCDVGIYLGATVGNIDSAHTLAGQVAGLKMYLNGTFGTLKMEALDAMVAHAANWPADVPLLAHAEQHTCAAAILAAQLAGRSIHIVHISRREEILLIRRAKEKGIAVTCEAGPHHLFLSLDDVPHIGAGRAEVRPMLSTPDDRAALREHIDVIDVFATDHAPHLLSEKDGPNPPPGYPGLETALPLYLQLVREGVIDIDGLIARCHTNPKRIFKLPEQPDTRVEVDEDALFTVHGAAMQTRAKWSPWEGAQLRGVVRRVTLRGALAYADGRVLAPPGSGREVVAAR